MAESDLEVRLNKKIAALQAQLNSLSALTQRIHRQVTHPTVAGYIKSQFAEIAKGTFPGSLIGTTNRVTVSNGNNCLTKDVTLTAPQDIHTGATPQFVSIKGTGLSASLPVFTDSSKVLITKSVGDTRTALGIGTGDTPGFVNIILSGVPIYANNAAAVAGGLAVGQLYRTGADPDVLCIVD